MTHFFSCDWGTSSFRLRLVDSENLNILAEISNSEGCAQVHREWQSKDRDPGSRFEFYRRRLSSYLNQLKQQLTFPVSDIPLVISGMASSSIGMVELPYKVAPFKTDGTDLVYQGMEESEGFPYRTFIISGVRTADDVMRGEETKLLGCRGLQNQKVDLVILPGTHPKHVFLNGDEVSGFKSYMTGEFFELLSQKSLLANSLKDCAVFFESSFEEGVREGASGSNLLHSCFLVRTNKLLEKYTAEQNFHYLSGLLLGYELKDVIDFSDIVLVGSGKIGELYLKACNILGIKIGQYMDADDALIKGQLQLLNKVLLKRP